MLFKSGSVIYIEPTWFYIPTNGNVCFLWCSEFRNFLLGWVCRFVIGGWYIRQKGDLVHLRMKSVHIHLGWLFFFWRGGGCMGGWHFLPLSLGNRLFHHFESLIQKSTSYLFPLTVFAFLSFISNFSIKIKPDMVLKFIFTWMKGFRNWKKNQNENMAFTFMCKIFVKIC